MEAVHNKASVEHFNNTMYLIKDEASEEHSKRRHRKDQDINAELISKKKDELVEVKNDLDVLE